MGQFNVTSATRGYIVLARLSPLWFLHIHTYPTSLCRPQTRVTRFTSKETRTPVVLGC
ncbi:hypothetical protein BGX38DRAFT_1186890 [Terfezia claveryi]|nr:hypothetical protein BGX38DRAFT_1186890 [Terfezia claveryi]